MSENHEKGKKEWQASAQLNETRRIGAPDVRKEQGKITRVVERPCPGCSKLSSLGQNAGRT